MALTQILASGTTVPDSTDGKTAEQIQALGRIAAPNTSATSTQYAAYVIYPDGTVTKDYSKVFFVNDGIRQEFQSKMASNSVVALLNIFGQPFQYNPVAQITYTEFTSTTAHSSSPTTFPAPSPTPAPPAVAVTNIFNVSILVNVKPLPATVSSGISVLVNVTPAETTKQTLVVDYPFSVSTNAIEVNISQPLINTAYGFLNDIISTYVDQDRELKTLLNFGEDKQNVVLSYRTGSLDPFGVNTLQLKLLQPVQEGYSEGDSVFVSREVANSVIDKFRVRFAPAIDNTPYLRPLNTNVKINNQLGKTLKNVTLKLLSLETGSEGSFGASNNVSFEDQIYRRWYSFDFNSSELNIDFTDYNNFVFYGSAAMRLEAFKQKLKSIESLTSQSLQFAGSVFTGLLATAGASYIIEQSAKLSKEKETIIRSFDRYEQYLYFTPSGSNSPYTASAWYADDAMEYNPIAYWPKNAQNVIYSPYSAEAEDWFVSQSAIANRFDEFNENNLVNTIPSHIRDDLDSASYLTFIAMIGHFFDTVKPYIDQFPNIYSRYMDPNEELSKDLVMEIAESVGFKLPTLNSIYDLSDNILGTTSGTPRRDFTVETYKRLLHNLPFFAKAKGTRTALTTLLKTFGINESVINVKESGMGTSETGSLYVFDEFTNGIDFDGVSGTFIRLPLAASNRTPLPKSLQLNLTIASAANQTVLNADNKWALNVTVHPTIPTLGRFELVSGSSQVLLLSSSYAEIFGDELINVAIRTYNTGSYANLLVSQVEGEDIIFSSSMSETYGANKFVPLWSSSNNINVGGSGSLTAGNFNGTVDEVRLWGISLSNEMTMNTVFDPGSNAGDSYTDASNYLYVQLSFDRIVTGSLPTYIINESPYKDKDGSPSLEIIEVFGIDLSSFVRYNRTVRQLLPEVGAAGYVTRKIRIAGPPVFAGQNVTANGVKQLSRTRSIVQKADKPIQRGRNKVSISTSPTEIINQNIIRNLGLENINTVLGSPTDLYKSFDKNLDMLKKHYSQYYYVDVNINQYIRVLGQVNSVLNEVVEYFIPSKATLLKGVTIEPNILERVKISPIRDLRFYGKNARRTIDGPGSLTSSRADYGATYNLSDTIKAVVKATTTASYDAYMADIYDTRSTTVEASSSLLRTQISASSNIPSGSYNTYTDTIDASVVDTLLGNYETYTRQHEDWLGSKLVSQSLKISRQSAVDGSLTEIDGGYQTYDLQSEDWVGSRLVSQSLKPAKKSFITAQAELNSSFGLKDLQHLDWYEDRQISQSYVSGTVEYITQSFMPRPRVRVDMGLTRMNKIGYNDVNKGTDGSEPYNRVYSRKLFDYEIDSQRPGGVTSLYQKALYDIPPSPDFRELGSYTYFNSPSGIYYYPKTVYTPVYVNEFNQLWDGEQFAGATTWSYGQSYNFNDVVYQEINKNSSYAEILGPVTRSAKIGNGRYYVFKTKPSYIQPTDGTAWYSGSVPSYIPPSLDQENWVRVRFKPTQVSEGRRVVFDTFTVPDASLNNFNTTTINVNKIIDIPDRYIDLVGIGNVDANGYVQGEIALQNIAALLAIQANNNNLRLRLYRTPESRDADLTRPIEQFPSGSSGVLLDVQVAQENVVQVINPIVTLVAGSQPPLGKIYYTVNNPTGTLKTDVTFIMYYFALEIEPRVPTGYLRKHYRFFRDNSTATKRRNYLGCKNTEATTVDGLPPVQVFVGEGTDIIVSPTQTNEEIITGGGGTLDVT